MPPMTEYVYQIKLKGYSGSVTGCLNNFCERRSQKYLKASDGPPSHRVFGIHVPTPHFQVSHCIFRRFYLRFKLERQRIQLPLCILTVSSDSFIASNVLPRFQSFLISQSPQTNMLSHERTWQWISFFRVLWGSYRPADRQLTRTTSHTCEFLISSHEAMYSSKYNLDPWFEYKSWTLRSFSHIPEHPRNADQRRRALHSQQRNWGVCPTLTPRRYKS